MLYDELTNGLMHRDAETIHDQVLKRIFWAHLQHPTQYPIFDQHVHRAMAFLRGRDDLEIPSGNASKVGTYLDEYRPFFREFQAFPQRRHVV